MRAVTRPPYRERPARPRRRPRGLRLGYRGACGS